MSYDANEKSAAQLQREVELQRTRVESTIDQIQERLSPGQLIDEMLAYTKGGSGEFVSSLQRSVTSNPLPVALIGASLFWLMAKPAGEQSIPVSDQKWDNSINRNRGYSGGSDEEYPIAVIEGSSMLRTGNSTDSAGGTYSEFADATGKKFKAMSDQTGKRAGHFVDDAGNKFRGFINSAGSKVDHFRDDAGNLIDDATSWASHTWQQAQDKVEEARSSVESSGEAANSKIGETSDKLRHQADKLNQTILTQFRDQPLVGGALAFAVGAALAAALPHTSQEDALLGEAADALKTKAGEQAGEVMSEGKAKAEEIYGQVSDKAADLYGQVKDGLTEALGTGRA